MNPTEITRVMLEWEETRRKLDDLEGKIKAAVLEIGKTQQVGNVVARYYSGRTVYDYETAGQEAPPEIVAEFTRPVTDWRAVCREAGLEPPIAKRGKPSVTISLKPAS